MSNYTVLDIEALIKDSLDRHGVDYEDYETEVEAVAGDLTNRLQVAVSDLVTEASAVGVTETQAEQALARVGLLVEDEPEQVDEREAKVRRLVALASGSGLEEWQVRNALALAGF